jgi:hypothetical protein
MICILDESLTVLHDKPNDDPILFELVSDLVF